MRKIIALLMALLMLYSPVACEEDEELSLNDILNLADPSVVDSTLTNTPTPELPEGSTPEPTATPEPVNVREPDGSVLITISAIGNIAIGFDDRSKDMLFSDELIANGGDYGFFLKNTSSILLADDVTIGVLAGTLTNSAYLPTTLADNVPIYRMPPSAAGMMRRGGIDVLSIENDHVLAHGQAGFQDTQSALRDGGIVTSSQLMRGVITVKETDICVLSYHVTDASDMAVYQQIRSDVTAARAEFPAVIVSFHWGDERSYVPAESQTLLAHYAVDCGASLVLGHHPEHIQPIELYNGVYICYSLGNFTCSAASTTDMTGFIVQVKLRIRDGVTASEDIRIIPIRISDRTDRNTLIPTVHTQATALDSIVSMLLENGRGLTHALEAYPTEW